MLLSLLLSTKPPRSKYIVFTHLHLVCARTIALLQSQGRIRLGPAPITSTTRPAPYLYPMPCMLSNRTLRLPMLACFLLSTFLSSTVSVRSSRYLFRCMHISSIRRRAVVSMTDSEYKYGCEWTLDLTSLAHEKFCQVYLCCHDVRCEIVAREYGPQMVHLRHIPELLSSTVGNTVCCPQTVEQKVAFGHMGQSVSVTT